MDTSNIPSTFWHALSFCMIVATIGFVYIAYRSTSVSIEIADTKITLNSALSTVVDMKSQLERENELLKEANASPRPKAAEPGAAKNLNPEGAFKGTEQQYAYKPIAPEKFRELDSKIKQVEKALKE